jgi:hypothetical protein
MYKRKDIIERHINEKMKVEHDHLQEFNELNQFWDKIMAEFDEKA